MRPRPLPDPMAKAKRKPSPRLPLPDAEEARLRELVGYEILDTPPEPSFDDLALLAAYICGTPTALVSLVDRERQWFKARVGMKEAQTSRDVSFCAQAIRHPDRVMVVNDATRDPRFAKNPLVTRRDGIRFYAGAPLVSPSGMALGTICVIDSQPRELSASQTEALRALSRQAVVLLEMRFILRALKKRITRKARAPKGERGKPRGLEEISRRISLVEGYLAEPSLLGMALKPPEGDE